MKYKEPETRTVYYFKPGQTIENTKISERALALIVPQNVYDRFAEYGTENEKVALLAEREAKRLAALKNAGNEMLKAQNFKRSSEKSFNDRKKKEDAYTIQFMKEVKEQKALEHAQIIKQARELILHNVPQIRCINRAVGLSKYLKELEEQNIVQKSIKDMQKQISEKEAQLVIKDVEKFYEEEKQRRDAQLKKVLQRKKELEKQIEENRKRSTELEESIKKQELEEMENMAREINELKMTEIQEETNKKETLKKMFLEAIENKKQYDSKVIRENEFQTKILDTYSLLKKQMEKMTKEKIKNAREEKFRQIERLTKKTASKFKNKSGAKESREKREEAIFEKVAKQREEEELQKIEEKKQKKEMLHKQALEQQENYKKYQEKRKKEEMDLKMWEMQQRYKRDEFNKNWDLQRLQENKNKRLVYGRALKVQMAMDQTAKIKKAVEEDDSTMVKEMLDKANQRILNYGEKVLQESRGLQPIYPIVKVIEEFKKDACLTQPDSMKNVEFSSKIVKRRRGKKLACTKPVKEEDIFHLS